MPELDADATRAEGEFDPLVGTVVNDRFRIVKRIARGGMGSVYFATQAPLSRPVAVKVLRLAEESQVESTESFRRRFLREASILATLQHPNIVTLFDYGPIVGVPGEHYFMAMEYLRGETLAYRFKAQGRLSPAEGIGFARQIGRGLREAHRCGFVHRDLKPSNIMLVPIDERNDIAKLFDFGIGKIIGGELGPSFEIADETRAGVVLGSPRYMAPEQVRSEPVDPRTDSYGLGVILFQALTGRTPFDGTNWEIMVAHCSVVPPKVTEVCPDAGFPESLSRLVSALLEKKIGNRPTIDEFLRQLRSIEDEIGGAGAGSVNSSRPTPMPLAGVTRSFPPTALPHFSSTPEATVSPPIPGIPPARRTRIVVGLVVFAVILACIVAGRDIFQSSPQRASATGPAPSSAPATGASPPSASPPATEEAASTFSLTVDSTPVGSAVIEDGKTLGITPLTMVLARIAAGAQPRRFIVQHEGYSAYVFEQQDSSESVHVHAALAPYPPRDVASRERKIYYAPISQEASSPKHNDAGGLEIRLRR